MRNKDSTLDVEGFEYYGARALINASQRVLCVMNIVLRILLNCLFDDQTLDGSN